MRLTVAQYAKAEGITAKAAYNRANSGKISRGEDGLIDLDQARKEWVENRDPHQSIRSKKPKEDSSSTGPKSFEGGDLIDEAKRHENLAAASLRKESAQADLKELELRERTGELLPRTQVIEKLSNLVSSARTRILGMGSRLGPHVAIESDPAACKVLIDAEAFEALSELSAAQV